nr:PREDICTED: GTPase IMAP family member 4-like [Lepisosteus oculatus]XP_015204821.1 PREDICTED: GTPase IMAP family member 4-like [Lepisosteus oculatus]
MCAPGPHAFLIVIPVVPFPESFRQAVEEHLQLLGERVWRHTIVLFTWGDKLKGKTIEEHIRDTGETLQWLVEKCGERYHVLNKNLEQQTQVIMLLDKIDEMVAENKGEAFISEEILQEIERRLKQQEEELKQKYEERAREVEEKLKQEYEERERRMREEMEQRLEEEWRRREKKLKEKWK